MLLQYGRGLNKFVYFVFVAHKKANKIYCSQLNYFLCCVLNTVAIVRCFQEIKRFWSYNWIKRLFTRKRDGIMPRELNLSKKIFFFVE